MTDTKYTPGSLIADMKIGWNLGNTLDAPNGETTWHNPVTTKEMIDKIKELGFNTVRVPVSWHNHVGGHPVYCIDTPWLDRVQQVVDYVINNGMYCILNSHHDDRMFIPTYERLEYGKAYLTSLWSQLSERFKDYGQKLLFEAMNEPRELKTPYEWHLDFNVEHCHELADCINIYNQTFVNAVRSSEHQNNKERFLMVPSYDAAPLHATPDAFVMPVDPSDRLVLSIHAYTPYNLCLNMNSDVDILTDETKKDIDWFMINIYKKFVSNNIPVVIGETNILNKNNPETRYEWCKYFFSLARQYGMMCCLWDTNGGPMKMLNRRTLTLYEDGEALLKGMFDGLKEDVKGVLELK